MTTTLRHVLTMSVQTDVVDGKPVDSLVCQADSALLVKVRATLGPERDAQASAIISVLAAERIPRPHAIWILMLLLASLSTDEGGRHYNDSLAIGAEHELDTKKLIELLTKHRPRPCSIEDLHGPHPVNGDGWCPGR